MSCFLSVSVIAADDAALDKCRADRVLLQAENIQMSADYRFCQKSDEMYKRLYENEKFWGEIKSLAIILIVGIAATNP